MKSTDAKKGKDNLSEEMDAATMVIFNLITAVTETKLEGKASVGVPERPARYSKPPTELSPRVQEQLRALYPEGLYRHQAQALEAWCRGEDVCLATEAASGKSLVVMSAALDLLERDPQAKVLALYPTKAPARSRYVRWKELLGSYGHEVTFIDGGVPPAERAALLERGQIVLMTPDAAKGWTMSHLSNPTVRQAIGQVRLLFLDEAHLFEVRGGGGLSMADLVRRLEPASDELRVMTTTLAEGRTAELMQKLTGRAAAVIDQSSSGVPHSQSWLWLFEGSDDVKLLTKLCKTDVAPIVVCVDSSREVEQLADEVNGRLGLDPGDHVGGLIPYRPDASDEDQEGLREGLSSGAFKGLLLADGQRVPSGLGELNVAVSLGQVGTIEFLREQVGRVGCHRVVNLLNVVREAVDGNPHEVLRSVFKGELETSAK